MSRFSERGMMQGARTTANSGMVPAFNLIDKRLAYDSKRLYAIDRGAQKIFYVQNPSQGTSGGSQALFQFTSPDINYGWVRHVGIAIPLSFSASGTTGDGANLFQLQTGMDALRAFPVQAICNQVNLSINNGAWKYSQANETALAILRGCGGVDAAYIHAYGYGTQDKSQNYSDLTASSMNPLNSYEDSTPGNVARGAWNKAFTSVTNNSTTFSGNITIYGHVMISPLLVYDQPEENAIMNISNVNLQLTFDNLTKVWSHNPSSSASISSFSVTLNGTSYLYCNWLQPPDYILRKIPRELTYSYSEIQNWPNTNGVLQSPGATWSITTNNNQLQTVPRRMYVFAKRQFGDQTYLTTDCFARLLSINITFMGVTGILSNSTEFDLYNISVKNGLKNISFLEWQSTVGSVLILDPAQDFQLIGNVAPGISGGQYSFQITANFQNISSSSITFTTYTTTVNDCILSTTDQQFNQNNGLFTSDQVAMATELPMLPVSHSSIVGGDFLGSIGNILGKVNKFLGDTKLISTIASAIPHPIAQGIATGAKAFGYGMNRPHRRGVHFGSSLMGAGREGSGSSQSKTIGGQRITADELRSQSNKYDLEDEYDEYPEDE